MNLYDRVFTDYTTNEEYDPILYFKRSKLGSIYNLEESDDLSFEKVNHSLLNAVDPNNDVPFPVEIDDLTRLHFIARNRRATTILEFGIGKSTLVFADALRLNKLEHESFVINKLRRQNPFELFSVDNSAEWIAHTKKLIPSHLEKFVTTHYSKVSMTTFNDRICSQYENLPNICPDIIYIDGPDQYNVFGDVQNISTRSLDRLPMMCDILRLEPFLLPSTLMILDGRTANARFLKNNLQANWDYLHLVEEDIHLFELVEPPLGKFNKVQIDFIYHRIS